MDFQNRIWFIGDIQYSNLHDWSEELNKKITDYLVNFDYGEKNCTEIIQLGDVVQCQRYIVYIAFAFIIFVHINYINDFMYSKVFLFTVNLFSFIIWIKAIFLSMKFFLSVSVKVKPFF